MTRNIYCLISIMIMFCSILHGQDWENKISENVLAQLETNDQVDIIIELKEQAIPVTEGRAMTKEEKGSFVFNRLVETAERSQKSLKNFLDKRNVPYREYWVVNVVAATCNRDFIFDAAKRSDVARISHDPWIKFNVPALESEEAFSSNARNNAEWGIEMIRATEVWDLGFRGEGVVVGGQDTGYEWQHPAISSQYRGAQNGTVDHNYHWHDAIHELNPLNNDTINDPSVNPCGLDALEPCADRSHGTHTMGTMVGDDGGQNQIGVAPQAKWIGCRNMDRGWGKPSTYLECFEWFLAPTDLNSENPDPTMAPHVINNSWSCPLEEGCDSTNWNVLELALDNLVASGIVVVVSASNNGELGCSTIDSPPNMFEKGFTVGATDIRDTLASFSSVGPVMVDGSGRLKPNVSAPGVRVRSSIRDSSYTRSNGTSMAGPHVAGAVALLISANPALAGEVEKIETALEQTAIGILPDTFALNHFGVCDVIDQFPNNHVGYGRIDVMAALESLMNTDTQEPNDISEINVWPTLFQGHINIQNRINRTEGLFEMIDISGNIVRSWKLDFPQRAVARLSPELPDGMYFYRLTKEGKLITSGKIVRQGR